MENEFSFFDNLNFGTDFTKQGLRGYGTYTDPYIRPVVPDTNLELIEPTGIETIPGPIEPFINQGGNDDRGISTLKTSTYSATLEDGSINPKYMNKYLDKNPNPANKPTNNQSII